MIPRTITRGLALLSLALPLLWATPNHTAAAPRDSVDPGAASFAVRAKRIYTMAPGAGEAIEGGTLLVVNGKIAAVGADVEIPAGIPVHDHSQSVIIPGLVDAGSRLAGSHRGQDSVGARYAGQHRPGYFPARPGGLRDRGPGGCLGHDGDRRRGLEDG